MEKGGEDSPYLNTAQAAHHLKMSPKALERLRVLGGGPIYRKHGGHVVYKKQDLDDWSDSRQRNRTDPPQLPPNPADTRNSPPLPPQKPCPEPPL